MTTITLTGIDERTDRGKLAELAVLHPRAEFGLLLTMFPEHRNRYPSMAWALETLRWPGLEKKVALHICGTALKSELGNPAYTELLALPWRIQINGRLDPLSLQRFCREHLDQTVITQWTPQRNHDLPGLEAENHSLLLDDSGGQGIPAAAWLESPTPHKAMGYAGGLGPHNIIEEAPKIARVAGPGWWVDMENSLREPDPSKPGDSWFSIVKAAEVLKLSRQLPPLRMELWMHSLRGPVCVERADENHVYVIMRGRPRCLERQLLQCRLCLTAEGLVLEPPLR